MGRRLTKEEFEEKAIKKHGNWYDYSKVVYINSHTKVCIICPIHGEFWQTPNEHLSGRGCPYCGLNKVKKILTKTQEQVIREFREIHGDWYDYSKVVYINANTKVCIICPIHGEFLQTPSKHLNGQGCPHCAHRAPLTKEMFIERSMLVHGDFYDYSKVEYINNSTKVCIICPIHGEFLQTPASHLSGNGCPHCAGLVKLTKEEFVERSILVHGDFYDYSKVEYVNAKTKVCIICPIHGEFLQTPDSHLSGCGCPKCANRNVTKEEWVEKAILVHGEWFDYSKVEYINNFTKVWITCKRCGKEFLQKPSAHLSGCGCPYCKASKLENAVENFLEEKKYFFIQKYRNFGWLRNKLPLELDFYLPDYNIGIECQGIQHFESIDYFGGEEHLKYVQNNDKLKKQLCEEHGVKLFYINYDDNIEEKIEEIIKNFSSK